MAATCLPTPNPRRRCAPGAVVVALLSLAAAVCYSGADLCGTSSAGFVGGGAFAGAASARNSPRVALRASGPLVPSSVAKELPNNWKRQFMKRMPDSNLGLEQMMQRITTVLIRNIDEKWRDAPMRTLDIMKEIGLRGRQIKEKKHINKALYLLFSQKVIYKAKQNPIRWEIHEEYRKFGVPEISRDTRKPWMLAHLLKFERTTVPKHGPIHGEYRPNIKLGRDPVDRYGEYRYAPKTMEPYKPMWEDDEEDKK
mmetsp:Transcript_42568/g.117436  ORF Transcript_42568/g.117436 Transcript_42568/m.117436 type:complete len:254 (-) Transcript_42568:108-869(-)